MATSGTKVGCSHHRITTATFRAANLQLHRVTDSGRELDTLPLTTNLQFDAEEAIGALAPIPIACILFERSPNLSGHVIQNLALPKLDLFGCEPLICIGCVPARGAKHLVITDAVTLPVFLQDFKCELTDLMRTLAIDVSLFIGDQSRSDIYLLSPVQASRGTYGLIKHALSFRQINVYAGANKSFNALHRVSTRSSVAATPGRETSKKAGFNINHSAGA